MQNIVLEVGYFEELVKKATLFEVVCALVEDGKGYLVGDIVTALKGGKGDGPSDCSES